MAREWFFMDKLFGIFAQLLQRWRYPVSLPGDVLGALGIEACDSIGFREFLKVLVDPSRNPKNLVRFMPRRSAEALFSLAVRKERFRNESLFSFYFQDSWVEFVLHFDEASRLRRVYVQHQDLDAEEGVELFLERREALASH